jgi:hypothetical protein
MSYPERWVVCPVEIPWDHRMNRLGSCHSSGRWSLVVEVADEESGSVGRYRRRRLLQVVLEEGQSTNGLVVEGIRSV